MIPPESNTSCANNRLGLLDLGPLRLNQVAVALNQESSGFREICAKAYTHILEPQLEGRPPDDILLTSVELQQRNMTLTMVEMMSAKKADNDGVDSVSDKGFTAECGDGMDMDIAPGSF